MKKITLSLLMITISGFVFGQQYIEMGKALANVNGHLVIDGNALQYEYNTKEQIIITGNDLVLQDRSSFVFNNVILQLSGKIVVKGNTKPVLMDSYIFCKDSGALNSPRIIEKSKMENATIGKVDYIKNLKGNPEVWVYSASGKRIFKGTKEDAQDFKVPIAKYDVRVVGVGFKDNILFAN